MKIVLWIIGVPIGLFILLWARAVRATLARNRRLDSVIDPAVKAVVAGDAAGPELVHRCAKDPALRNGLYARLAEIGKTDVFPEEFRTIDRIAESDMVRWLMHPNELQTAPTAIELLCQADVKESGKRGRCFLFRFRVDSPHWAADRGWMAGIAGPFWDDDARPDAGRRTFSELTPYDAMTDSEHVRFLQAAATKRGLTVPS